MAFNITESGVAQGPMINYFFFIFALCALLFTGCDKIGDRPVQISMLRVCHPNPKQAQFVVDCAAAANPKSDEEGEDLVEQCEESSHRLFKKVCSKPKPHYLYSSGDFSSWEDCEGAALGSRYEMACKGFGQGGSK